MRMSCNGCRVLRKGCGDDCSIRPCLQWIRTPESQANATLFLAKFYGRAGLLNLINAGSDHHRPAIFRSLLYEACGRIVNPIYGSVGLLWSGSWDLCQSAVDAVLRGDPISQMSSDAAASTPAPPIKAYDIRHVSRDGSDPRGVDKTRIRFKRSKKAAAAAAAAVAVAEESSCSHVTEQESCAFSVETVEAASHVSQGEPVEESGDVDLELMLGFERPSRAARMARGDQSEDCTCRVDLGLQLPF